MKYLLLLLLLLSFKAHAQTNTPAFSGGFELAAPSRSAYKIGFGVSAKFDLPITTAVSLTVTGGLTFMDYKNDFLNSSAAPGAARFVPLKVGVKYFASPGLYGEAKVGAALETNYNKQHSFAFSIGPGFIIPINDKNQVDISFRYENWSNQLRQTGIRFAYRFGL